MMQGGAFSQCFYEIKQTCPSLQNVQYSHKKSLKQQIDNVTQKIPIMKSINKLRLDQEQKIYNNIHKLKKLNLMHEINMVNPNLHHELRSLIKNEQLTHKYEEYKQQQEQSQIEIMSETHDSYIKYPFDCSGVKIFNNRPLIRNIMDDFEQESSQYNNDSCINKYLDLN